MKQFLKVINYLLIPIKFACNMFMYMAHLEGQRYRTDGKYDPYDFSKDWK